MGRSRIIQTIRDRGKVNLKMFPKRKYKSCRSCSKRILIDTYSYIVTQQMHNDKIRRVVCYVYVHLHVSVFTATIVIVFYQNTDKM